MVSQSVLTRIVSCLALTLLIGVSSHASGVTATSGSCQRFVLVPAEVELYARADPESPRVMLRTYLLADPRSVAVMRLVREKGEWLEVENLSYSTAAAHCFGSLGGIEGDLQLRFFVKRSTVAKVVDWPVELRWNEGTGALLNPGVRVALGADRRWLVATRRLKFTSPIPIGNIGESYCLSADHPVERKKVYDSYPVELDGANSLYFARDVDVAVDSSWLINNLGVDGIESRGAVFIVRRQSACGVFRLFAVGARFHRVGDEVEVPLDHLPEPEGASARLKPGAEVLWPDGSRVGVFEGPSPLEIRGEILKRSGMRCTEADYLITKPGEHALLCFRSDDLEELPASPSNPDR